MPLLFLIGCAYTVRTLSQVSPGGAEAEFYAVVRDDYFDGVSRYPRGSDAVLIRCAIAETEAAHVATCQRVLTDEQAFSVADKDTPTTFQLSRTPGTGAAAVKQRIVAVGIADALALLDERELLNANKVLNAEQAATVRAQARKEACAMIATVTDRPCDAVLQDAGR